MEAIKTYYRAQRPPGYDAELWDNAIDLLLAENQDSREVGHTILEANGADMFVADCWCGYKGKDKIDVFEHEEFTVFFDYCSPSIGVRDKNYDNLLCRHLPSVRPYSYSAIGHFEALIKYERKIKSALGLQ